MNKEDIQKRVLQNGKPIALNKFTWCKKTNTFASVENNLVIDFKELHDCTIKCGSNCTIKCGSYCTINCGNDCNIKCGSYCTIKCGSDCTIKCGSDCTINCDNDCTINCGNDCTINCGSNCTIKCGIDCVIVFRSRKTNVIQSEYGQTIQTPPYLTIDDFLVNGVLNDKQYIIADNILSEVINKKGDIYKVINYNEVEHSYIIKKGDVYSHGETIKQAREDLIYKLSNRDTSKYDDLTMETVLTKEECIQMYMIITGACSSGTKYFVNRQQDIKDEYTVAEIIELTQGQYNHSKLVSFMKNR